MKLCKFQPLSLFIVALFISIPYLSIAQQWTQKASFGGGGRYGGVALSIGTKGYVGTGQVNASVISNDWWEFDPATNVWTQKASLASARFHAMSFTIGNKGYVGLGSTSYPSYNFVRDLWEYDPVSNTWAQKANFPGPGRYTTVSFAIGTKGYVGTGWSGPYLQGFLGI